MDYRLLIAINDVLNEEGVDTAFAARDAAAEAGPAAQQSLFEAASKQKASTGRPIPTINGAAAFRATMARIGGGAKYAGGDGIEGGEKVLDQRGSQAQRLTVGLYAASFVARIGIRYAVLVRQDRKAARDGATPTELA